MCKVRVCVFQTTLRSLKIAFRINQNGFSRDCLAWKSLRRAITRTLASQQSRLGLCSFVNRQSLLLGAVLPRSFASGARHCTVRVVERARTSQYAMFQAALRPQALKCSVARTLQASEEARVTAAAKLFPGIQGHTRGRGCPGFLGRVRGRGRIFPEPLGRGAGAGDPYLARAEGQTLGPRYRVSAVTKLLILSFLGFRLIKKRGSI